MTSYHKSLSADEAAIVALEALAAIIGNARLGPRLLALTGLSAETLRARAGTTEILCAILDFLLANEEDLLMCASEIGRNPIDLLAARQALGE